MAVTDTIDHRGFGVSRAGLGGGGAAATTDLGTGEATGITRNVAVGS